MCVVELVDKEEEDEVAARALANEIMSLLLDAAL